MKFFTRKTLLFKFIVSLFIVFTIIGISVANISNAESWGFNLVEGGTKIGGKLIDPVVDLLLGIGDGIINIIQQAIMGTEAAVTIDTGLNIIIAVVAAIAAIAVVGLAVAYIGPILAEIALMKLVAGAAGVAKIALAATTFVVSYTALDGALLPDVTLIPTYTISPEEIFSGDVLLFDVNIFNEKQVYVEVVPVEIKEETSAETNRELAHGGGDTETPKNVVVEFPQNGGPTKGDKGFVTLYSDRMTDDNEFYYSKEGDNSITITKKSMQREGSSVKKIEGITTFSWKGSDGKVATYEWVKHPAAGDYYEWKIINKDNSPDEAKTEYILSNKSETSTDNQTLNDQVSTLGGGGAVTSGASLVFTAEDWKKKSQLQFDDNGNITNQGEYDTYKDYEVNYYFYLKDGEPKNIDVAENRIVTSANNSAMELKSTIAKWYYVMRNLAIVALMVVLVYVGIRMVLTSIAEEKAKYKQMLMDWFVAMCLIFLMQYIMVFANNFTESLIDLFTNVTNKNQYSVTIDDPKPKLVEGLKEVGFSEPQISEDGSQVTILTNLMGKVRLLAQEQDGSSLYIGYAICFLVLVLYTIIFTYVYLKRLLYTMFLTIIAPLVAVSYPLDKIGDGKSQAFDMWLKEYMFNLLIQPFHLLLYVVLISSAFDLASSNVIYSLVALGFMIPAEKFLRKMFGFDKASTPGFLGGAAGAAVAMTAVSKIGKFAERGVKGKPVSGGKETPRFAKTEENDDRGANSGNSTNSLIDQISGGGMQEGEEPRQLPLGSNDQSQYEDSYEDINSAMFGPEVNELSLPIDSSEELYSDIVDSEPIDTGESQPAGEPKKQYYNENSRWNRFETWAEKESVRKAAKEGLSAMGTIAKVGSGVTVAGLGMAAGIASGDPSDVLRNAGAGAYAGASIAKGTMGSSSSIATSLKENYQEAREDILKEKYGENYKDYVQQRADAKFKKNEEARKQYAEELKLKTKEEIDKAMEDAVKYREWGVTNDKTIIKAMKTAKENNRANYESILAAQLSEKAKTQKDFETIEKKLSERMSREKAEEVLGKIDKINSKDNLIR